MLRSYCVLILAGGLVMLSGCTHRTTYVVPVRTGPPRLLRVPMQPGLMGGGARVWVNPRTHVYHYPGSRGYGNTKYGRFESERQAIAEGNRPAANGQ